MPIVGIVNRARLYASVGDVRALGINAAIASDDRINDAMAGASRWVDAKCDQTTYGFGGTRVATEKVRVGHGDLLVLPAPVTAITAVTPQGSTALPATAYTLDSPRLLRWLVSLSATFVAITGTWGYASVPALIRQAAALYAAHLIVTDPTTDGVKAEQIGNYSITRGATAQDGPPSLYDQAVRSLKDGGYIAVVIA